MQNYSGANGTIKIFDNLDADFLTDFNDNTLKVLADHDHTNNKLHGVDAIQAGTITAASIANSTITAGKLAASLSFSTVANDTYVKWRNNANTADLDGLKLNTDDNLEIEQDIDKFRVSNNVTVKGTTSGGSDHNLFKVNTSDQWEFLNTAYSQSILPKTDSTYDLGSSSLRWSDIHTDKISVGNTSDFLDYFEEGTWTPRVTGVSQEGVATYTVQIGRYQRVGNWCTCQFAVTWTGHTGAGDAHLKDFPFTAANVSNFNQAGIWGDENLTESASTPRGNVILMNTNTKEAGLRKVLNNNTVTGVTVTSLGSIYGCITYLVEP